MGLLATLRTGRAVHLAVLATVSTRAIARVVTAEVDTPTNRQAATLCNVSLTSVQRWIAAGKLRANMVDGTYQISVADLEPFRRRHGATVQPDTGATVAPLAFAGLPALGAATGLVGEATALKELLLTGGEDEALATVAAGESLIVELGGELSLVTCAPESRPQRRIRGFSLLLRADWCEICCDCPLNDG